ncbi:MAG TPA: agmatine deiminase family protein [Clostridia bacterium]|nr:agmatine deiminase family protein [Clostridia bacterium]
MPAEWEPHAATWLAWPHNRSDWPGKFEPIPYVYAEIVRHLARVEHVELIVTDEAAELKAREILHRANVLEASPRTRHPNIRFHRWPTNRGWLRDTGAIFVRRKLADGGYDLAATDWRFNAWAKYNDWKLDDQLPALIAKTLRIPRFQPEFTVDGKVRRVVLEGGSIDVNGRGTLITTEECLLSNVQQRNPGLSREDIEFVLSECLGIKKVLWLERGIVGDDTHGHVDDITRFVGTNTIVTCVEPDPSDANHEPLRDNYRRLARMSDQNGKPFRVVTLPMPAPIVFRGQRLPASYANFYIASGIVLVPVFDDPNDRLALNTLADLMPRHTIVPIYCGDLVWGLGTIHCMTQQQPAI